MQNCQAKVNRPLIAKSTGITSALFSSKQYKERITPLPAPTQIPIGPLSESTHPGIGSFTLGTTKKEKKYI